MRVSRSWGSLRAVITITGHGMPLAEATQHFQPVDVGQPEVEQL